MSNIKSKEQVVRAYKKRRKVAIACRVTFVAYGIAFAFLWFAVRKYPLLYYVHTHFLTGNWEMFLLASLLTTTIVLSLYGHRCPVCDTGYMRRRDRPTPQDEGYCSTCRCWFNIRDYLAKNG